MLADRMGPRWVSVTGMIALGVGLAIASFADQLLFVAIGIALGIGVGIGLSYVPSIGAVQPWFTDQRGFASGIAVSGIGVGTLLGPIVASALIPEIGWRTTLRAMGGVAMVLGIGAALFLENDPAERGVDVHARGQRGSEAEGFTVAQVLRCRPFWLLYFGAMFVSVGIFIPFVHVVPYALDRGFEARDGAYVLGAVGIGSTVGRFLVGGLADRIGRENALLGAYVGITAMLFVWLGSTTLWSLFVFALIFGTCYGGFVALAPAVAVDYFGAHSASGVIGVLYTSVGIGTLVGPTFAGIVYDQSQDYAGAILFGEAMAAIGVALTLLLPNPRRWRQAG